MLKYCVRRGEPQTGHDCYVRPVVREMLEVPKK